MYNTHISYTADGIMEPLSGHPIKRIEKFLMCFISCAVIDKIIPITFICFKLHCYCRSDWRSYICLLTF